MKTSITKLNKRQFPTINTCTRRCFNAHPESLLAHKQLVARWMMSIGTPRASPCCTILTNKVFIVKTCILFHLVIDVSTSFVYYELIFHFNTWFSSHYTLVRKVLKHETYHDLQDQTARMGIT